MKKNFKNKSKKESLIDPHASKRRENRNPERDLKRGNFKKNNHKKYSKDTDYNPKDNESGTSKDDGYGYFTEKTYKKPEKKRSYANRAVGSDYRKKLRKEREQEERNQNKKFSKKTYANIERAEEAAKTARANRDRAASKGDQKPYGERQPSERNAYSQAKRFDKNKMGKSQRSVGAKFSMPKKGGGSAKSKDLTRINKYLAHSGIGSRRDVEKYILSGMVKVNGKVMTDLSYMVGKKDVVQFDGRRIKGEQKRFFVMNKPKDFITTTEDDRGRRTVMDLIGKACDERIYPVGRLDRNTTGVLLFTNDGDMAKKLTHPSHGATKIYHVHLDSNFSKADFEKLKDGITLEDGEIKPDKLAYIDDSKREIGVEIHSGRNRIVRRMFAELGYEVVKLDRVFFAGLTKRNLKRGQYRELDKKEVDFLKMLKK